MKQLYRKLKQFYTTHMQMALAVALVSPLFLMECGCNVHEYPEKSEGNGTFVLQLKYTTGMVIKEQEYVRDVADSMEYDVRMVVHAYPMVDSSHVNRSDYKEFIFTKDVRKVVDCCFPIELPKGEYDIEVWSDHVNHNSIDDRFYTHADFGQLKLCGVHTGCDDNCEAFRGNGIVDLAKRAKKSSDTLTVNMVEPFAKFEFISTDVKEFLTTEKARMLKQVGARAIDVDLNDYKVKFVYTGFYPNTYNLLTDKPIDAATGVTFDSYINVLNDDEASLGFDYVLVNGKESSVLVQVQLLDKDNRVVSQSNVVDVYLKRGTHTVVKDKFLVMNVGNGISIDNRYDGEFTLFVHD